MKAISCGLLLLLLGTTSAAAAPRPLRDSEQAVLNFGFATQLGSGIYSLAGRTLQVYRLPIGYTLPAADDARARLRFTLPVTIGFLDFEAKDVVDTGLPQRLDTYSVVPGVSLDYALTEQWRLEPFGEAGIARDTSTDVDQRIYSVGLRSRYDVERGVVGWQGYGEVLHTTVEDTVGDNTDDFVRVRLGATARRPFVAEGVGRRPDFLVYGFAELFTDAPRGPAGDASQADELQYELGFTLGATETWRLWRIPLPRIGFGYRFGSDLSVYRIVFGSPY
jgi:hypothetical protein